MDSSAADIVAYPAANLAVSQISIASMPQKRGLAAKFAGFCDDSARIMHTGAQVSKGWRLFGNTHTKECNGYFLFAAPPSKTFREL